MTIDLATLLADPTRVADVPVEVIPDLIGDLHRRVGDVEGRLLARVIARPGTLPVDSNRKRPWLRVEEAAAEYGIAPKTLYDWIYKRRIASKKLGPKRRDPVLVPRSDLERLTTTRSALRSARIVDQG